MNCTRCEGTGFLNLHQLPEDVLFDIENDDDPASVDQTILNWIKDNEDHDVQVCDCCGDGEGWYGIPGEHDPTDCESYAYNGGLPECW